MLPRFLKALSFASLDKEDVLSPGLGPAGPSTLQRCSSLRSMVSSAAYSCQDDYVGLALPVDISHMFHVRDVPYFLQKTSPPSEERSSFLFGDGDGERPHVHLLKQQFSMSEQLASREQEKLASREQEQPASREQEQPASREQEQPASQGQEKLASREQEEPASREQVASQEQRASREQEQPASREQEETGLQEHTQHNCLYCVGARVLGHTPQPRPSNTHPRTSYGEFQASWVGSSRGHLEVMPQSKFSGVSGCSEGSICSTPTPSDIVLGGKGLSEDAPACRVLLRKEVLRLVINLSSSVGTKGHETGLLTIKEKFPYAFEDVCLYSEVSLLLASCLFRLASRRFIQELFQDVHFTPMYEEAEAILMPPVAEVETEPPTEP